MTSFDAIVYAIDHGVFTPPKPIEKPNANQWEHIKRLDESGRLILQRKNDGHGHLVVIGQNYKQVDLRTLGLTSVTEKHKPIVANLESLRLPRHTILGSEISCLVKGKQDRFVMSSINRPIDVEKSLLFQTENGLHPLMSLFGVLMWHGEDARRWSNLDRFQCIKEHIGTKRFDSLEITEQLMMSLADARVLVEKNKWEGLVLYDPDAETDFVLGIPGEDRPSIPRPFGAWKDKKDIILDFVAYDFVPSTAASHYGGVKDLHIGMIDPKTKEIIPCGKCGSGLKHAQRMEYADKARYPFAVEVTFESWSKNGKVVQGKVTEIRDPDDKHYLQCLASEELLALNHE